MSDWNRMRQAVIDAIDEHLPYREGGPRKPDWTARAVADAERLYPLYADASLGLSRVEAFVAAHGLPADKWYVREFRRQLILIRMRLESQRGTQ